MTRFTRVTLFITITTCWLLGAPLAVPAEELIIKSCTELMRLAEACRDDLRAVNIVLGSAVDAGDLDRIRNYKIRRDAAKRQLEQVVKVLELKGCAIGR